MIAAAEGFEPFQELSGASCCNFSFVLQHFCQQDLFPMQMFDAASWNLPNQIPLEHWLAESQDSDDRERLHCLGNLVIPQQAALAVATWSNIMQEVAQKI